MLNYPVTHHVCVMSSRCSSQIIQCYRVGSWKKEMSPIEEDEDDEDGLPFATFESGFENRETVKLVQYKSVMLSM